MLLMPSVLIQELLSLSTVEGWIGVLEFLREPKPWASAGQGADLRKGAETPNPPIFAPLAFLLPGIFSRKGTVPPPPCPFVTPLA